MNIQELNYNSNSFPQLLRDIASPPKKLYLRGQLPDLPMVAVVGSRHITDYGKQVTYRVAYDLASAGICVVSGLAYGVDAAAHRAALEAKGSTMAVLGNAIDQLYPAGNRALAEQIIAGGGAVISEYAPGTDTQRFNFPTRNRIIAGLCLAVVVPEANASSGSLITANFALQANRLVMAVPGNITSPRSAGTNNLIKNGAKLVTSAVDILTELELKSPVLKAKSVPPASKQEAEIISLIQDGHSTTPAMLDNCSYDAAELASALSLMEITGKIRNLGAGQWIVNS